MAKLSNRVKKHIPTMALLSTVPKGVMKKYLRTNDKQFTDAISECCLNIIRGAIPLTSNEYTALERYQNDIRKLSTRRTALAKKKKIIQKGGFLSALIAPLIGVLGSVVSGLISKKKK